MIACVVSNRDHSFAALRATKECVIAIPAVELAEKVVAVGNCSGRDVDKFEAFHLTQAKAERVTAPLIAECFANIECKVVNTRFVNRYNLFVLEGLKAWIDPARKDFEDDPSPGLRQIRRRRGDDRVEIEDAMIVRGRPKECPSF